MTADNHLAAAFAWEQHCCLPLAADSDIGPLDRYRQVGVSYVSVNVGYAPHGIDETMRVISSWRRQIRRASKSFELVAAVEIAVEDPTGVASKAAVVQVHQQEGQVIEHVRAGQ